MKPFIIGIAGGTGSGKSTLVRNLSAYFGDRAAVISYDDYYRSRDDLTLEERAAVNYDEPAAFETDLLVRHLRELKQGNAVEIPVYDFTVHNRSNQVRSVIPGPVIILEGILLLSVEELRSELDLKVFVDADADVRFGRRVKRDVRKRGRTIESVLEQYQTTVKPMHDRYVEPSKKCADVIIPGGGKNPVAISLLTAYIESKLPPEPPAE